MHNWGCNDSEDQLVSSVYFLHVEEGHVLGSILSSSVGASCQKLVPQRVSQDTLEGSFEDILSRVGSGSSPTDSPDITF